MLVVKLGGGFLTLIYLAHSVAEVPYAEKPEGDNCKLPSLLIKSLCWNTTTQMSWIVPILYSCTDSRLQSQLQLSKHTKRCPCAHFSTFKFTFGAERSFGSEVRPMVIDRGVSQPHPQTARELRFH